MPPESTAGVSEKTVSVASGPGQGLTSNAGLGALYCLYKCSPAGSLPYCVVAWKVFLILDAFIHLKVGCILS
jgi:hypothetical protein